MTNLYDEDNVLSIADRTISSQYRQFRTSRKELKQLILDNKKTYLLSKAEIQKYEKCLDGTNGNLLNSKDEIYVDIEGFSMAIAKKLGNNYLRNNFILVSTKQIECDSIRDSHFSKYAKHRQQLIRKIFNIHRNTIEQILMGEALIGIVNQKDLSLMIDNPESLFNIEIVFDTPNNAISKLKNIRKDERILLENEDKLKDRVFLKNLLQNIEGVSAEHGSLDRIPDKEINLKEKVYFNKLHLNGIDIYCLRFADEAPNIFVYFFTDSTLLFKQSVNHTKQFSATEVVNQLQKQLSAKADNMQLITPADHCLKLITNDEKENYMKDDLIILNGKYIESLNVLMELGMVGYNPYLGLERAVNMILRNRKEKKENINGVEQKNRFDLGRDEKIPERAKELLVAIELLVENKRDKDFFINLGQIKIYMTYPLIQNEILYELLTRMENDEYKSCYMDTEKFIKTVSNMNDEQLREFIEKILDSLEFREENNTMVNIWLMENRKNVCDELGIKFELDIGYAQMI